MAVFQLDTAAAGTSQHLAVFFGNAREGTLQPDRDGSTHGQRSSGQ